MNHHYYTEFFATLWALGSGEILKPGESHIVFSYALYHAFDDSALASFEVPEQLVSAPAIDISQFSCSHNCQSCLV